MGLSNGEIAGISIGGVLIIITVFYINTKIKENTIANDKIYRRSNKKVLQKYQNIDNNLQEIKNNNTRNKIELEEVLKNSDENKKREEELKKRMRKQQDVINYTKEADNNKRIAEDLVRKQLVEEKAEYF